MSSRHARAKPIIEGSCMITVTQKIAAAAERLDTTRVTIYPRQTSTFDVTSRAVCLGVPSVKGSGGSAARKARNPRMTGEVLCAWTTSSSMCCIYRRSAGIKRTSRLATRRESLEFTSTGAVLNPTMLIRNAARETTSVWTALMTALSIWPTLPGKARPITRAAPETPSIVVVEKTMATRKNWAAVVEGKKRRTRWSLLPQLTSTATKSAAETMEMKAPARLTAAAARGDLRRSACPGSAMASDSPPRTGAIMSRARAGGGPLPLLKIMNNL